jgi:O-antigen/teichoic acid export membrane protein
VLLLRILCFVPFVHAFTDLGGEVLKVRGEDRTWLAIVLLNLASLVAFGIAFTWRWGPAGMAVANFLSLGNVVMAWRMAVIFEGDFRELLEDLAVVYLAPLVPFVIVAMLLPAATWERFAASLVAAAAALLVLGWRFRPLFGSLMAERPAAQ